MNKRVISRLSRYKKALHRLEKLGFVKVFSDNLADASGATPAQVRKDFSIFGIAGNKRGGYSIEQLIKELDLIFCKDKPQEAVVAGAGHIGTAMMNYPGFENDNIRIVAAFDIDPLKFNEKKNIPVLPIDGMKDFIRGRGIKLGIIAVPDIAAQQVMDMMVSAGVKGVLNFAPIRLRSATQTVINNINLGNELENIIYFMNKEGEKADNEDAHA